MVHISDGVLPPATVALGWAFTAVIVALTLKKLSAEEVPKLSLFTSVFFVASLIHFPVGPTSVHLILNGVVGIMTGHLAYLAILIGLVLQALFFGHGGLTTIGVNTVDMGLPALIVGWLFRKGLKARLSERMLDALSAMLGGLAVCLAVVLTSLMLLTCGSEYVWAITALAMFHVPVIVVEALATCFIVALAMKVKPEMLSSGVVG